MRTSVPDAVAFPGEVFAAAEGATYTLRSDRARFRPVSETAIRVPALTELNRAVAIAVTDHDMEVALLEAAEEERFEAVVCHGLDAVLETIRTERTPIVVLEAAPERSLDELAADARAVLESSEEGVTVVYVTTTTPPGNEIRPEITDWLVWPASQSHLRTKLRAWLFRRRVPLAGSGAPGQRTRAPCRALEPRHPRHRT